MGRRSGGIYRTTVSIPQDLKARMDAAGEPVNWSAVAARAFEEKLAEIASRKKDKDMDDVIQRLRASKGRSDDQERQLGRECGAAWAKNDAEAAELGRLAAFLEGLDADPGNWGRDGFFDSDCGSSAYSTAEQLYFEIHPENGQHRQSSEDFWEAILGQDSKDAESDSFLRGFAEGAEEVWDQVKDQL